MIFWADRTCISDHHMRTQTMAHYLLHSLPSNSAGLARYRRCCQVSGCFRYHGRLGECSLIFLAGQRATAAVRPAAACPAGRRGRGHSARPPGTLNTGRCSGTGVTPSFRRTSAPLVYRNRSCGLLPDGASLAPPPPRLGVAATLWLEESGGHLPRTPTA